MQKVPRFSAQNQKDFVAKLHTQVNHYFKANGLSRHANWAMISKTIFYLSLWVGTYLLLWVDGLPVPVFLALWAVLGFSLAMVTVNIGHDAIHGAYSSHRWVNQLLSHTFNLNGASAYMWVRMHNIAHHTYTNVSGYDEDISPIPILRVAPRSPRWAIHRYQHLYAFLVYTLTTISWVFIKDYKKFFINTVGNFKGKPHPPQAYFWLFFFKFVNYTLFLILPLLYMPQSWEFVLGGFLLMHAVGGWCLAMIFMMAHAVENVHFPEPDVDGYLENCWAAHQLYTTANFGTRSRWLAFFTGGLNTQIEHHLFPHICSIHYPALSEIVRATAQEHGLPYQEASLSEALRSHHQFLKQMGEPILSPVKV
ncbi:MAG: acyl-CoA desaturase [Microscillaceae bacterium]